MCLILIIQRVITKTSLIADFPAEFYVYHQDRLAFQTSSLLNSSMSVTQVYPTPLISRETSEEKVHDFTFNDNLSGAESCNKVKSSIPLEFIFICKSKGQT